MIQYTTNDSNYQVRGSKGQFATVKRTATVAQRDEATKQRQAKEFTARDVELAAKYGEDADCIFA